MQRNHSNYWSLNTNHELPVTYYLLQITDLLFFVQFDNVSMYICIQNKSEDRG